MEFAEYRTPRTGVCWTAAARFGNRDRRAWTGTTLEVSVRWSVSVERGLKPMSSGRTTWPDVSSCCNG